MTDQECVEILLSGGDPWYLQGQAAAKAELRSGVLTGPSPAALAVMGESFRAGYLAVWRAVSKSVE